MVLLFSLDNLVFEEIEDDRASSRGGRSCSGELPSVVPLALSRRSLGVGEISSIWCRSWAE